MQSDYNVLKIDDMKLYLRKDVIDDYWVFEGIFFADEYYPLKLKKTDIVLDVGANIGMFTLKVAPKVKKVIAIEPEPDNFQLLKKNIEENSLDNVILLNYAVSDKEEAVYFNTTGGSTKVSDNGIPVIAKDLNTIINELEDIKPNIIKMDIEGYEGKVLSSFKNYEIIDQIILEVHSKELKEQVTKILSDNEFIVEDVSKVNKFRVVKNIIKYFPTFLSAEGMYDFFTTKQAIKYLLHMAPSPVSADNPNSEQKILYAYKK